ncbi:hypothetical protein HPP92_026897 [Vanilla planifolia]|uniref:DDT domain-containing protein n=1 Tax=Vanilla planifolia TaxID=51239 RepID=A0A835PCQ7_VANPL|nr:hypothetical protein HPP92_026897 [Vanilla planifolia]
MILSLQIDLHYLLILDLPIQCVGDLLWFWNFCISFWQVVAFVAILFEDFENAICYKDSELMLILESHSAILNLLIKDGGDYFMAIQNKKQKFKVKLTNWAEYLCHFLDEG